VPRVLIFFIVAVSFLALHRPVDGRPADHLRVSGTSFHNADGSPFQWRGITAFRLVEFVAAGRQAEAAAFLDWAASRHLTVVRVFTMARHLFTLAPADGIRALPELLRMAAARGLHVEIVGLVDTKDLAADADAHLSGIAAIASRHPNALVEIANEPAHPTQSAAIHDVAELRRLAALVPASVPVSLGSAEENPSYAGGRYATFHFPRTAAAGGWGHVVGLAEGARLVRDWAKPLISDEPIGAADQPIAGRRDDDPERFLAAALLTRLAGMGATFHYEGGLQARIPAGRELECFARWNEAWSLLPEGTEWSGMFREAGAPLAAVRSFARDRVTAVFERQGDISTYVLAVGVRGDPALEWREGWSVTEYRRFRTIHLITAHHAPQAAAAR
jgi:hypothetical protein